MRSDVCFFLVNRHIPEYSRVRFHFLGESSDVPVLSDPFFAIIISSAVVCSLIAVYLYVRVSVMEYFVEKADALSRGQQPRRACCCCCFPIVLESLARLMCIRKSYVDVERGMRLPKVPMREKNTSVLVDAYGTPLGA